MTSPVTVNPVAPRSARRLVAARIMSRMVARCTARGPIIALALLAAVAVSACGAVDLPSARDGNTHGAELGTPGPIGAGEAPVVLAPDERARWDGEWFEESSDLDSNMYARLDIFTDERGFEYRHEYREVPYGPNSVWSGPLEASLPRLTRR